MLLSIVDRFRRVGSPKVQAVESAPAVKPIDPPKNIGKAKLIIWDLDDTLWQGTLAEGDDIVPHQHRFDLIEALNARGVVNALCSKNDFAKAKATLKALGKWDLFVFPEIAFAPKGEMVKRIISDIQLRAPDVVFVDDNAINLREVEHANPGICTVDASTDTCDVELKGILTAIGDGSPSRVAQYRMLARKRNDRTTTKLSNEDFLRSCGIKVAFVERTDNLPFCERIEDMVNRTNQLNFTKSRVPEGSMRHHIIDPANYTVSVFVWDNYGFYGLIGFASVNRRRALSHFLFSCRTMNMGIEEATAHFVSKTAPLDLPVKPERADWITVVSAEDPEFQSYVKKQQTTQIRGRIMANCHSGAIAHYMGRADVEFDNWPRRFSMRVNTSLSTEIKPFMVYAPFIDYTDRGWRDGAPSNKAYEKLVRRFIGKIVLPSELTVIILPQDSISRERPDIGLTNDRLKAWNDIWRDHAQVEPKMKIIEAGRYVSTSKRDPRHYSPHEMQRIATPIARLASRILDG